MKRLCVIFIAALLLTGCGSGQTSGGEPHGNEIIAGTGPAETPLASGNESPDGEAHEPPSLYMSVSSESGEREVKLIRNGYSWKYSDIFGKETMIMADSPAPWQTDLLPFEISSADSVRVKLPEGAVITEAYNYSINGDQQAVEFLPTGELSFPAVPLGAAYSVSVEFPQGRCGYVFAAEYAKQGAAELTEYPCTIDRLYTSSKAFCAVPDVIASEEELAAYIGGLDDGDGALTKKYAEKFPKSYFDDGALLIVRFEEGSGSITYSFCGIDGDDNAVFERRVPEIGTCDMAYYLVFIEIPQDMVGRSFSVAVNTVAGE